MGLSQVELADKIGVSKQTLYKYENDIITNIPSDKIEAIAKVTGATPAEIMGWEDPHSGRLKLHDTLLAVATENGLDKAKEIIEQYGHSRQIPVYGRVAAGIPIEAVENIIDFEEIPVDWKGEYGCLIIKGDSMSPRILDGDRVVVKRQDDAESGDIVIAIINGHDGVCKKLIKHADGITLQSLNPAYDPMYFSRESQESVPVTIWGKVVELRGRF